ncbi:hypothetical protein TVAG_224060 [Trichomonas vaginalis G3]|uniref:Uncharacterized protein n=1 Tax=Trichomonas vaginalis (strain ATCC PRA-98 / G3) TaxID=412133 RepID=A2DW29_TRIV3|nr:nuclear autoantigenic sperm protein NASP -related family [Trichomonas vaginalis G3]EAY15330.1 hypothetical protein TVAG_224060 [Trichomonas vaginalis G3]KAI5496807.1 nuclear autoantigenic sperm protein NASP -related family [Trichomonas vaginalis G3]|eukprot:XP_001327553.1 hypothetical protein [Trichomonas vaginalis G3]
MSSEERITSLREQAQAKRKGKQYKQALDLYDELLQLVYKDGELMNETICRDFIHYSECLIYSQTPGHLADEEDLEIAWDCLEKARLGYEAMPDSKDKFIGLIDTHDLLGELTLTNNNYQEAQDQFKQSAEIGLAHPEISWRLPLNSLFCRSNALLYQRKVNAAYDVYQQLLNFIDDQLKLELPDVDKADLNDFKKEIAGRQDKIKNLRTPHANT